MNPELRKRVLTGVIGGAAVLALIILGGRIGAAAFALIISLGMSYEFSKICFSLHDQAEKRKLLLGTTWLVAFLNFWMPRAEYELLVVCFLGFGGYFLFTAGRHPGADFSRHFQELSLAVFGTLYVVFLPLYLPLLRDAAGGHHWILIFLLVVWAGDTGAYFAGRKFGKRKLYALISPKKTVEGAVGGLAAGYVIALGYKLLIFGGVSWSFVLFMPGLVGIMAQVGDLCESFLKRSFDKKDSGSILPGHGGFLDRFDGVVFGLPIMYGCLRIFG